MPVYFFGTPIDPVSLIFIFLESGMLIFQFFYYLFRPEDKTRLWYLILLILLLLYNVTRGIFPNPKIDVPIFTQQSIEFGSGFLMESFFPYCIYKVFDLKSSRWHVLFGIPSFLMVPFLIFFVIILMIKGNLHVDLKYGYIAPVFYSLVQVCLILLGIKKYYKENRNYNYIIEEIAVCCAISPWVAMTVFSWFKVQAFIEVLCTNAAFTVITVMFIWKSIKNARLEYQRLQEISIDGMKPEIFQENCLHYKLTRMEMEIVQMLYKGMQNKEIARGRYYYSCLRVN